jgi:5-methylthioribose kinase
LDTLYDAPDVVAAHAKDRIPSLGAVHQIHRLSEGHINFVWRVVGTGRSVIVKAFAPFAASDPSIRLGTRRADVEASALEILSREGALAHVGGGVVQVPRLLDHDRDLNVLILEDLGILADIGTWAATDTDPVGAFEFGTQIGEFIGRLHRESTAVSHIASRLKNPLIQVTRQDTQYRPVEEFLRRAGVSDATRLGRRAFTLGEELCRPGGVFIMGDLWPRSLLVSNQHLAVIDWEFAHWGRPAQDVGHLVAHLWMLEDRADNLRLESAYERLRTGFLTGYRLAVGPEFGSVFGSSGFEQGRTHAGAEILVRTVGRFADGYVYDGLDADDPTVSEAVEFAASLIRGVPEVDPFGPLLG